MLIIMNEYGCVPNNDENDRILYDKFDSIASVSRNQASDILIHPIRTGLYEVSILGGTRGGGGKLQGHLTHNF